MKTLIRILNRDRIFSHIGLSKAKLSNMLHICLQSVPGMLISCLCLSLPNTYSQTVINGGDVYGIWSLSGSPYQIYGNIEVPPDSFLIIEAGVDIEIKANLCFTVKGNILSVGKQSMPILFTSPPNDNKWQSINITGQGFCIFSHTKFSSFKQTTFEGGGVIRLSEKQLYLMNCEFYNNRFHGVANAAGGAIYIASGEAYIYSCTFAGNEVNIEADSYYPEYWAGYGGAIAQFGGFLHIENSSFNSNRVQIVGFAPGTASADSYGGAIYSNGFGLADNCTITNNQSKSDAKCSPPMPGSSGDAYSGAEGGGVWGPDFIVKNCIITGNQCLSYSLAILDSPNSTVGAMASGYGGGVHGSIVEGSLIKANDCFTSSYVELEATFAESLPRYKNNNPKAIINHLNQSVNDLPDISTSNSKSFPNAFSRGGGLYKANSINNTIYGNTLYATASNSNVETSGAGTYSGNNLNCIIYFNNPSTAQIVNTVTSYSCVQGGYGGNGNISGNPLFVTGPQGEWYLSQLQSGQSNQSPCVDAGDPAGPTYPGSTRTDHQPDQGITDMGYHYLAGVQPPVADFAAGPGTINCCDNVYFCNISKHAPVSFQWFFDGTTAGYSAEENPIVQYYIPGYYNVTLIVSNSAGSDTLVKNIYIHDNNCPPLADFFADKTKAAPNDTVHYFDNSVSNPVSWQWWFEGGIPYTSFVQNPLVVYTDTGSYSVQLKVANNWGQDSITKTAYLHVVLHPLPSFQANHYTILPTDTVCFTDLTANNPEWWQWEFEGGEPYTSSLQNPSVVYPTNGLYDVTLIAGNAFGSDTLTIADCITVGDLVAEFTANIMNAGIGDTIRFFNNTGAFTSWFYWEFPGGIPSVSYEENPEVLYHQNGFHDILFATGNYNTSDTISIANFIFIDTLIQLNIKIFPAGPFNGANLSNLLNSYQYLPLYQPYANYPWFYSGNEQVGCIPTSQVVDWVLLEFRGCTGGPENATPETILKRQAAFLIADGSVRTTNGISSIEYVHDTLLNLYFILYHRNHLPVMSTSPITKLNNNIDFTTSSSKAFGGFLAQIELAQGVWGMIPGNADGNGMVNNQDKLDFWKPQAGKTGYWAGDFNLNGHVDNSDKIGYWEPNVGSGTQTPDY